MEEERTEAGLEQASEPQTAPPRGSPIAVFLAMAALALASFGGSALVIGGMTRVTDAPALTEAPRATGAPARTAAATAGTAGGVRVVSTNGRSQPIGTGRQQEVTFIWVLEGARENDPVTIHFYQGTRSLGQQSGVLDPSVFSFATSTLTLTADLDCSTVGWSAEILTVRGTPVDGDTEAKVPGATCP